MTNTLLSPLHDTLKMDYPVGTIWGEMSGMPIVLQFRSLAEERQTAQTLALADVSFLPRVVLKGPEAAGFLGSHGLSVPGQILQVADIESGGMLIRTGGTEFFFEDGVRGNIVQRLEAAIASNPPGVYRVLRQDASIVLSGARATELLRHTCSYDFSSSDNLEQLVMTHVAGVSCSVLRRVLHEMPVFRLWTDGTFGIYIWRTLRRIAQQLGGDAVGAAVFYGDLIQPQLSTSATQP